MKVLHINNYWGKKSGTETVFKATILGLQKYYPSIKNFVVTTEHINRNRNESIAFFSLEQWQKKKNKLLSATNYVYSLKNKKTLEKIVGKLKPDIIHIHDFYSSISPSILIPLKKMKKTIGFKTIQTLHSYVLMCPNISFYCYSANQRCTDCLNKTLKLNIFWRNCDRRGYIYSIIKGMRFALAHNILSHKRIMDLFIAPSNFMLEMAKKEGLEEKRLKLIRNPSIFTEFTEKKSQKENLSEKKNEFVYFGRLSEEKNLIFLITTFIELLRDEILPNDAKLILIGDGEKKNELSKIRNHSKFKSNIHYKSFMEHVKLFKYIRNAKFLILPSSCYENAPLSIIEGFSLNLIPIVSNIGGMKELIDFLEVGYLFSPEKKDELKEAVIKAMKNFPNDLKNLQKKKYKLKMFSIKSYTKKIYQTYKKLLSKA